MDSKELIALCHIYRGIRRRSSPEESLQEMATYLQFGADVMHAEGNHTEENKVIDLLNVVVNCLALVEMRKDAETRRGRYWWTGRLSQPTDCLLFAMRQDDYLFWLNTCSSLSCSIKHGIAHLRQPQWRWFRIQRPDGTIILDRIDRTMTLGDLTALLSES